MALVDAKLTFVSPELIIKTACLIYLDYRSVKTKTELLKARDILCKYFVIVVMRRIKHSKNSNIFGIYNLYS